MDGDRSSYAKSKTERLDMLAKLSDEALIQAGLLNVWLDRKKQARKTVPNQAAAGRVVDRMIKHNANVSYPQIPVAADEK